MQELFTVLESFITNVKSLLGLGVSSETDFF